MAFPGNYHADSDADDEYERSILTSPMPPTDDEASSANDSDTGSHDHTPTTFDGPDHDRNSPRTIISEWTSEECVDFLGTLKLEQYGRALRDNVIRGDVLINLKHEELKEMGIVSVGHRLTILKGVYDIKIKQDVPIEPDDYVPLSAEDGTRNKQATQEDISRIIHSLEMRDQRILQAEAELRRVQDEYRKLREELLPLFKMSKERNESLPSPVFAQNVTNNNNSSNSNNSSSSNVGLSRKPSKNKNNLFISSKPANSPTYPPTSTPADTIINSSGAVNNATAYLAQSIQGIDINTSSPNMPSPGISPSTFQLQQAQQQRYNSYSGSTLYGSQTDSYMSDRPMTASTYAPSVRPSRTAQSIRESPGDDGSSAPAVEVFKSFRVSLDDPCYKVLPAALKKYNIQADWRQYALYIVYGDQERCLGYEEKPLILFKQLDKEGRKPMFMLRRHVTPVEGHTRSTNSDSSSFNDHNIMRNQSQIQLPGGVL